MNQEESRDARLVRLRQGAQQAEAALRGDAGSLDEARLAEMMEQVSDYQAELEAQNEELRQAQEVIEAARLRLADLYDFAPIGYLTMGEDGRIGEANIEAASLIGIARSRLKGRRLADFILADDHAVFLERCLPVTGIPASTTCTLRMKRGDGKVIHVQLTVRQQRAEGSSAAGAEAQVVMTDVTASVRAEYEMLASAERLGEAVAERNRELELTSAVLAATDIERLNAEANLLAEQKKFTDILDGIPDCVLLISSTNEITYANPQTYITFGPIEGRKCYEYLHQAEKVCAWCSQRDGSSGPSSECVWTSPDGKQVFETFSIPFTNASSDHSRLVICRDVTASHRSAEELRSSQARLSTAHRIASLGDWTWHLESGRIEWSEDTFRILGHAPGSLEPTVETFLQMVTPDDVERVEAEVGRIDRGEQSLNMEINIIGGDGHERTVHIRGDRVVIPPGAEPIVTGTLQDITDRRLADKERSLLVAAMNSVADGILVTDASGVVLYANTGVQSVTGFTRQDITGQVLPILDPTRGQEYPREILGQLTKGNTWRGVVTAMRKDGGVYQEENYISAAKDPAGRLVNLVVIKRDVTEQLALESVADAVNVMSNTGYIFTGIRHEIGNPINAIRATLQHIRSEIGTSPTETITNYINRAIEEIIRVEQLLNSLKSFNRFEDPQIQGIDVESFLAKFSSLIGFSMGEEGIELEVSTTPGAYMCMADPRALQQVLLNVVTNAIDACAGTGEGKISIDATRSGDLVTLLVSDNGRGIAPEDIHRVFNPFFTTKAHGTGLGLLIARKLLTLMHGALEITSEADGGTWVKIQLPASPADA